MLMKQPSKKMLASDVLSLGKTSERVTNTVEEIQPFIPLHFSTSTLHHISSGMTSAVAFGLSLIDESLLRISKVFQLTLQLK